MSLVRKTDMGTLSDFLLARIAEDETAVVELGNVRQMLDDPHREIDLAVRDGANYVFEQGKLNIDRMLADIRARRSIVERARAAAGVLDHDASWAFEETLRDLASVYSDHLEYQEAWRP